MYRYRRSENFIEFCVFKENRLQLDRICGKPTYRVIRNAAILGDLGSSWYHKVRIAKGRSNGHVNWVTAKSPPRSRGVR